MATPHFLNLQNDGKRFDHRLTQIMNNKCLVIPKNREGEIDSDYGRYDTPNIVCIIFPNEEVDRMFDDGVVETLNRKCDIGIDDYESEEIPFEKIEIVM